jgi:molybdate transport system substrate-binding protein
VQARLALVVLGLVLVAGASASPGKPRVFAATSLAGVLPAIDRNATYTFSGSSKLAAQIEAGASADVFASANTSDPADLYAKGLVSKPVVFAHNTVVVIVPAKNPAHVHALADLARKGVRVEIADATVALGGYTLQILKTLNLSVDVATRDDDVRTVVANVEAGKSDAGFVYASDAHAAGARVLVVAIPKRAQPNVAYAAAVVLKSPRRAAAQAFVAELRSARAQAAFRAAGFR